MLRIATACLSAYAALAAGCSAARAEEPTWFGAKQTAAAHDPLSVACIEKGLPGGGANHDPTTAPVVEAMYRLDLPELEDAFAKCRLAFRAFPSEPKIVVAHATTESMVALLLFGLKDMPPRDETALRAAEAALPSEIGMTKTLANFYVGSDYEFGVGAKPDAAKAAAGYRAAAEAGDKIAAHELARLLAETKDKP